VFFILVLIDTTESDTMNPCSLLLLILGCSWHIGADRPEFRCPEEFGYYPHPGDCSLYFVCVFGGPLLESCTGGLVYSQDLQTCDWPRNVPCNLQNTVETEIAENINIAIESKKNAQTSREPRKQTHGKSPAGSPSNSLLVVKTNANRREDVEAEILRNIDEEVLDALSPQPSIVSVLTHGLEHLSIPVNSLLGGSESSPDQSTSFGSRDEGAEVEVYSEGEASEEFHSDTSELEKALLRTYPGVSSHLDDNHEGAGGNDFYYTEWNDSIYDDHHDYDYILDEDDRDAAAGREPVRGQFEPVKETLQESPRSSGGSQNRKKDEILLDHRFPPHRPRRRQPLTVRQGSEATKCNEASCLLPDCRCGGTDIPGNLTKEQTPQLVILTFDDSINDLNQRLYQSIFHPIRRNPNGCPISATFYVSHEWTDYGHVQNMYSDGHEIASHSISHSFGEQFSKKKWLKEMAGQREILAAYGGVHLEDIRGMRAPFLAIGGNPMFTMLHEANFTYDSSMPIYENKPPAFPYTLDHKIFHDCMIPPCPTKAFPGLWELPLVMWNDHRDGRCSMADACSNPPDAEGVYMMILKNFERHYQTNRAPFGLFYHPAWFTTPHHKEGFELFLDTITAMEDVWLVTSWQAIQWMREPTPLSSLNSFPPFQCNYQGRPPHCTTPKVCNLWHKSGLRYMRTCQSCPKFYPWTSRTGIANSLVDQL